MYLPPHFAEDRVDVLHEVIRASRVATLVSAGKDGLVASHVPLLLDPAPAPYGTLLGHLARANPQCGADGAEALAMFLGPEAYVSPSWYATKRETGKVVPTWNYVAIHASGTLRFFDDPARLLALVSRLTDHHEGRRDADRWSVADAPPDYIRGQLKGIVGFELPIARLEGKWKMSQNRTAPDRAGASAGLAREGGEREQAVSRLIAEAGRDDDVG